MSPRGEVSSGAEESCVSFQYVLEVESARLAGIFDVEVGGIEENRKQFLYFCLSYKMRTTWSGAGWRKSILRFFAGIPVGGVTRAASIRIWSAGEGGN